MCRERQSQLDTNMSRSGISTRGRGCTLGVGHKESDHFRDGFLPPFEGAIELAKRAGKSSFRPSCSDDFGRDLIELLKRALSCQCLN